MRALIFTETGEPNSVLKLAEIPTPPLAHGEALVIDTRSSHVQGREILEDLGARGLSSAKAASGVVFLSGLR